MDQLRYRYPGVKPFETSDKDIFFGRKDDIEDLLGLIKLEKLVVLFGKSGYGKSSLVKAGILPELSGVTQILIRFGSYVPDNQLSALAITRKRIEDTVKDKPETGFLDKLNLTNSLWLDIKRSQLHDQQKFLFIFDQFEEFFTYPIEQQYFFKEQLAELLYTKLPQDIRNQTDLLDKKERTFISTSFDARVIFSIRWDRLGMLDSLKDKLPAILHKRYELKGLTRRQAEEAITRPASERGDFKTLPFTYAPDALSIILDELTKSVSEGQKSSVEAFQLQIICQSIESKVEQTRLQHITLSDLPDLSDIYTGLSYKKILG